MYVCMCACMCLFVCIYDLTLYFIGNVARLGDHKLAVDANWSDKLTPSCYAEPINSSKALTEIPLNCKVAA